MPTLTYLGPEGTFTHEAARGLACPDDALIPLRNVPDVVRSVESGEADSCVVAFENSLEGTVPGNLDQLLFETSRCVIAGERIIPVSFALFRPREDEGHLRGVSSHPFGLAQCSRFIAEHDLETRESLSTAAACQELALESESGWGAIGPPIAGEIYGLRAELEGVEDDARAATRFLLLRTSSPSPSGRDRSAFSLAPAQDEPGSLVRLVQEFSSRDINLTAVKSRPTKELLGEYAFYIECEGHIAEPRLREAVIGMLRFNNAARFLGSFPEDSRRPARRQAQDPVPAELFQRMLERTRA